MALINKLSAIGDAIRGKTGGTEKLTLDAMPEAINSITTGSGGVDIEPIVLSGDCSYKCAGELSKEYLELHGDTVSTKDVTNASFMFYKNPIDEIHFELNSKQNTSSEYNSLHMVFKECHNLKSIPKMNNFSPSQTNELFYNCYNLKEIPEDIDSTWDWSYLENSGKLSSGARNSMFSGCYSLRYIPVSFLNHFQPSLTNKSFNLFYNGFKFCCVLDELVNLPVLHNTEILTTNYFDSTFSNCSRLSRLKFSLQSNYKPYKVNWKSHIIDLSQYVGYAKSIDNILNYNSGITADKEVTDDTTYAALKNDADWFTLDVAYSRYNHDSAVETINSLPDASAYLADNGGTNTIKFKGASGSATDGGAINTMTEEEISVATAKGWTVSYV